jgi:hypothetical protein
MATTAVEVSLETSRAAFVVFTEPDETQRFRRPLCKVLDATVESSTLTCRSSIVQIGPRRNLLTVSYLGAGSPHWTISATGSSVRRREFVADTLEVRWWHTRTA